MSFETAESIFFLFFYENHSHVSNADTQCIIQIFPLNKPAIMTTVVTEEMIENGFDR